jgi:L-threonate 2-dehydrogenase
MKPTVAIIAPGSMGAAVGTRLAEHGLAVRTSLGGRSEATAARARSAGLVDSDDDELAASDFILSIVPPGQALALGRRLAPALSRASRKPIYVDCNAVSPTTVGLVAAVVAPTGAPFVDAGIIGGVPHRHYCPALYASGNFAERFGALREHGLDVRVLDGPIGMASALKLSYAGITKGLIAIGTAMVLAATRAGVADALRSELASSQTRLFEDFARQIPSMYPKAYRWIAEMEEIGAFAGDDEGGRQIYQGFAELYGRFASDARDHMTAALDAFLRSTR